ncbi:uncharacterized protein CC84DRAFT_157531 [Paraphaeosphaeria sporulosa]|uniref:Uncharacterized protein n=1 Tax=Paraphaeosphaeria sporulosa TaxID=1460663 RepID=A0A177CYU0_9PLEO|nr:uncharacterized protein CC84DRAFT_157531 [Paraphaeosphaeria sporulosa]OAG12724.1 hypothetical protein CC84DRAFT_157531 [Paraphaeosphaeria sporulosa]
MASPNMVAHAHVRSGFAASSPTAGAICRSGISGGFMWKRKVWWTLCLSGTVGARSHGTNRPWYVSGWFGQRMHAQTRLLARRGGCSQRMHVGCTGISQRLYSQYTMTARKATWELDPRLTGLARWHR